MEKELEIRNHVISIAKELEELKGIDSIAIDINGLCSWTGYVIVVTSSSNAQLKGLVNQIKSFIYDLGYEIKNNSKNIKDSNWALLDCGDFIVNLMSENLREFYDIEEKWKEGEVIYSSSSMLS